MSSDLIHNRGRGPEIVGTRITVYNLVPYFLDPTATENYIAELYELTVEQVAAARAYVLNNAESVLARHTEIEAHFAAGNPPEVIAKAREVHTRFVKYKQWFAERKRSVQEKQQNPAVGQNFKSAPFPTFREWLGQSAPHSAERS